MGIAETLTSLTDAAQQYVVAPLSAFGMAGFVFNAEGEAVADLKAEITDHYLEDNTAVQDQIALHPKKITLKGFVGELIFNGPGGGPSQLAVLAQKLTQINSLLPSLTAGAISIQNAIRTPSAIKLSDTSNLYGLVQNVLGATGQTANQQNAYTYFRSLWETKTLMGVQTPWEFLTNMAIESVIALQDDKTKYMTDFSVVYKQMRFSSTGTTAFLAGGTGGIPTPGGSILQGAASLQAQPAVPQGTVPGVALPSASLPGAQGSITGANSLSGLPTISRIFVDAFNAVH